MEGRGEGGIYSCCDKNWSPAALLMCLPVHLCLTFVHPSLLKV